MNTYLISYDLIKNNHYFGTRTRHTKADNEIEAFNNIFNACTNKAIRDIIKNIKIVQI